MVMDQLRLSSSSGHVVAPWSVRVQTSHLTGEPTNDTPCPTESTEWPHMTSRPQVLRALVLCCYGVNTLLFLSIWVRSESHVLESLPALRQARL